MASPFFSARHVLRGLDPSAAVEAVREAFVEHARGNWFMPSKVYVPVPPDGDFRAMPARGGGYSVLKWVTSFPRNPERGLPTVSGVVLLSDATTGAYWPCSTPALSPRSARGRQPCSPRRRSHWGACPASGGRGVNGRAVARALLARGRDVSALGRRPGPDRPGRGGARRGRRGRDARAEALGATSSSRSPRASRSSSRPEPPSWTARQPHGRGRAGQGRDRPRGAGARPGRRRRVGAGEPQRRDRARRRPRLKREHVAELGRILTGEEEGRRDEHEITVFDSTGLAVQDLAVARAVYEASSAGRRLHGRGLVDERSRARPP